MKTHFLAAYWGHPQKDPAQFLQQARLSGYAGVEINLPQNTDAEDSFFRALATIREESPGFILGLQLVPAYSGGWQEERDFYRNRLEQLARFQPDFINAHTGRDFYRYDQNCAFLEEAADVSAKWSVPIWHETHRGRFSFHAPNLLPYLEQYPDLALVGDLSHFCVVSESLLQGQEEIVNQILTRIRHLHARVGHEQAPQVSNPTAPEWHQHVEHFLAWWMQWYSEQKRMGRTSITITPEFGPTPYLPVEPYSQKPFTTPATANAWMRDYLIVHGF